MKGRRRSAEERAAARLLGVDRAGRPTARALGINPKRLRSNDPDLTPVAAARLSRALLDRHHSALATDSQGAGRSPDTRGLPAELGRVKGRRPDPAGVDSDAISGHVDAEDRAAG